MKVEKSLSYLNKEHFFGKPMNMTIVGVKPWVEGMYGRELTIILENPDDVGRPRGQKTISLWPKDVNQIIDILGEETDDWIDQKIRLETKAIKTKKGTDAYAWIISRTVETSTNTSTSRSD